MTDREMQALFSVAILATLAFVFVALNLASREGVTLESSGALKSKIDSLVSFSSVNLKRTGIFVYLPGNDTILYALNGDLPLIPASNQKLLVAAAALSLFGPDHRFKATMSVSGPIETGTLNGSVYLKGFGDPTLRRDSMAEFASALKSAGVVTVIGGVIVDASYFDDKRLAAGWPENYVPEECSPVGALTLKLNSRNDPAISTGEVFVEVAREAGISIMGKVLRGAAPPNSREVWSHPSPELREILPMMNKLSDNFMAEMLVKSLGARFRGNGSWDSGLQVISEFLRSAGLSEGFELADGSGLSRLNKISARNLAKLLSYALRQGWGENLISSLSVAGVDGTLASRPMGAASGRLRAKTGSLSGVSTLSGVIRTVSGKTVVFSMMFNDFTGTTDEMRVIQDAVGNLLASL